MRPFRFAVSIWSAHSRAEWKAKARKAEDLGFDVLTMPDHLIEGAFPPLVGLCTAAEATSRLRVGTLVLNNDFRHPALVARDVATIDLLTDGRCELGLGAGHMESESASIGLPFDAAATRIARLTESVGIIQRLLAGEKVTFDGRHYQLREHALFPRPVQNPVPILIGGNGRAVLELAARRATIVGFTGFFPTDAGRKVNASHFGAAGLQNRLALVRAAAGDRFESLELNALVQAVVSTENRRTAAEELAGKMPVSVDEILDSPFLLLGTRQEMVEALLQRRERFGLSYFTVFESAIDTFAPVVAELKGH